jgi:hypothetical protein
MKFYLPSTSSYRDSTVHYFFVKTNIMIIIDKTTEKNKWDMYVNCKYIYKLFI